MKADCTTWLEEVIKEGLRGVGRRAIHWSPGTAAAAASPPEEQPCCWPPPLETSGDAGGVSSAGAGAAGVLVEHSLAGAGFAVAASTLCQLGRVGCATGAYLQFSAKASVSIDLLPASPGR